MNSLDRQYQELLFEIIEKGVNKSGRNGETRSLFGKQIRHKMAEGFPLITTKKIYWNGVVAELLWFLCGDTNIKFLIDNGCNIWNGDAYKNYSEKVEPWEPHLNEEMFIDRIKTDVIFAHKWGELGPIYGKQWRSWEWNSWPGYQPAHTKRIDQIQNLINELKTNPDSRRLMVNAWNVGEIDKMVLPPCHWGFQVYTRELTLDERQALWANTLLKNQSYTDKMSHADLDAVYCPQRKISLSWNQRSVDTFLGLPFNIASYGLLLTLIAKLVNMVPDELIGNLGDVHLYKNHMDQAREQIKRKPYSLPQLNINTEWWATLSGECGIGPLDTDAFFAGLDNNVQHFTRCLLEEDIQLGQYEHHLHIHAPLNN